MTELVYYVAASLDGLIATPDGGIDWLDEFIASGEDYGYAEFYAAIDAIWMGHRTYEKVLGFGRWPYPGKRAWVSCRHAPARTLEEVTVTSDTPAEVLAACERDGRRRAWLVGGGELAASCRAAGLISEYVITTIPVLLGAGIPLLAPGGDRQRVSLEGLRQWPSGVVQATWRPCT